jgi:hypothetical protein
LTHPLPKSNNISNDLFQILSQGAHKHSFPLPPSQMDKNVVKEKLREAMENRYQTTTEMINDIISIKEKKGWFTR